MRKNAGIRIHINPVIALDVMTAAALKGKRGTLTNAYRPDQSLLRASLPEQFSIREEFL